MSLYIHLYTATGPADRLIDSVFFFMHLSSTALRVSVVPRVSLARSVKFRFIADVFEESSRSEDFSDRCLR